jgi:hypothetical protein
MTLTGMISRSWRRACSASFAQDHEVIGVGHEPRAKALFKPELLPSQHKPAHVKIGQQRGDR